MPWHLLLLQLGAGLPIDFSQPRRDQGQPLHGAMDTRLFADQRGDALQLIRRDIDEEDIGQAFAERLLQIPQDSVLHQKYGEDQHDARAQRGEHGNRLVPRPVKVR
jgi:hypothetical protein